MLRKKVFAPLSFSKMNLRPYPSSKYIFAPYPFRTFILIYFARFPKFLRHFHYPAKHYDYFVRRNRRNPYTNAENRDKTGKTR